MSPPIWSRNRARVLLGTAVLRVLRWRMVQTSRDGSPCQPCGSPSTTVVQIPTIGGLEVTEAVTRLIVATRGIVEATRVIPRNPPRSRTINTEDGHYLHNHRHRR